MAKTITFKYDDKDYTLEFNRQSIVNMEKEGFSLVTADTALATSNLLIFKHAFDMHHSGISPRKVDEMFAQFPNKGALFEALAQMVGETYDTLSQEPEEGKNLIKWEIN